MPTQAFPVRQLMTDTSLIDLHGEGFARSRNAEATQRTPAVESWFGGDSGSTVAAELRKSGLAAVALVQLCPIVPTDRFRTCRERAPAAHRPKSSYDRQRLDFIGHGLDLQIGWYPGERRPLDRGCHFSCACGKPALRMKPRRSIPRTMNIHSS
jgi:hypothetical protein